MQSIQDRDDLFCPSFSSYMTSDGLFAEMATPVRQEVVAGEDPAIDEEDEFEFAVLRGDSDEEQKLSSEEEETSDAISSIREALNDLLLDGGDLPAPSVSDLEGLPEDTYCVWAPRPPEKWRKSGSTSSSSRMRRRWKLLDLIRRCNSEGNSAFVFLNNPSFMRMNSTVQTKEKSGVKSAIRKMMEKDDRQGRKTSSPLEMFYARNLAMKKANNNRRSYLPYRQDLVCLFAGSDKTHRRLL